MNRPVSPAEFAVRFGLEPVDVEWLMRSYRHGMSDEKLRREIQPWVARETVALRA
jgi:hypothetical protein